MRTNWHWFDLLEDHNLNIILDAYFFQTFDPNFKMHFFHFHLYPVYKQIRVCQRKENELFLPTNRYLSGEQDACERSRFELFFVSVDHKRKLHMFFTFLWSIERGASIKIVYILKYQQPAFYTGNFTQQYCVYLYISESWRKYTLELIG